MLMLWSMASSCLRSFLTVTVATSGEATDGCSRNRRPRHHPHTNRMASGSYRRHRAASVPEKALRT